MALLGRRPRSPVGAVSLISEVLMTSEFDCAVREVWTALRPRPPRPASAYINSGQRIQWLTLSAEAIPLAPRPHRDTRRRRR